MRIPYSFITLLFPAILVAQVFAHPENNEAFLQTEVAEIHITVSPNHLNTLLGDSLLVTTTSLVCSAMKALPFQILFKM